MEAGQSCPAFFVRTKRSPDGKRIAVTTWETVEDRDLWMFDLERGGSTRLTVGMQPTGSFSWWPDGRSLAINSLASGMAKLERVPVDGSGTAQQLTSGVNNNDGDPSVSPDGATLIFMRNAPPANWRVMTLSLSSNDGPRAFVGSSGFETWPMFSPDGRWVAYESGETGQSEVHVRPFPAGEPRVTVSAGGGLRPGWSRDGCELFYRKGKEVWSVSVSTNGGFHASAPKRLFTAEWLSANPYNDHLQPSSDRKRFLTVRQPPEEHPERRIVYAPNWIAELDRAPGGRSGER